MTEHEKYRKSKIYSSWKGMRKRCYYPKNASYKYHGARGIAISEEWPDFDSFYRWSINNGWQGGYSIDRIDNDKNYSPSNCRWASKKDQARNRRDNLRLTYKGQDKTIAEWSEITGQSYRLLKDRFANLGRTWTPETLIETPAGARGGIRSR